MMCMKVCDSSPSETQDATFDTTHVKAHGASLGTTQDMMCLKTCNASKGASHNVLHCVMCDMIFFTKSFYRLRTRGYNKNLEIYSFILQNMTNMNHFHHEIS